MIIGMPIPSHSENYDYIAAFFAARDIPQETRDRVIQAISYAGSCWLEVGLDTLFIQGQGGETFLGHGVRVTVWASRGVRAAIATLVGKPVIWGPA